MFSRRTRIAGKVAKGAGKGLARSPRARRAAGKTAKGASKAALRAGKAGARGAGRSAGSTRERGGRPYLRYALFAAAGFGVGVLIARLAREENGGVSSSFSGTTGHHAPDPDSPAGRRGETWGTGAPLGAAGGGSPQGSQGPEGPNRTGSERDYSDPSAGPLIGEQRRPEMDVGTERQQEIEQRVRTRIGEDPRTMDMPRVNVEVNDGVAELRGVAPSDDAKEAATEIAAETEGVREVRNLIAVS